jgi:hypothetical protein
MKLWREMTWECSSVGTNKRAVVCPEDLALDPSTVSPRGNFEEKQTTAVVEPIAFLCVFRSPWPFKFQGN